MPQQILENENYSLYWEREMQTDRHVQHNRPDILLLVNENKEILLVDFALPAHLVTHPSET